MIIMITCLVFLILIVNVVFAIQEQGVSENVFQNVVVDFAVKKEILEDAVVDVKILSEGGTEEDRRIDPPLNFGIFIENNNNIWKKLGQSSPR